LKVEELPIGMVKQDAGRYHQKKGIHARRVGQTRLTRSGSTSQGGKTGAGKK